MKPLYQNAFDSYKGDASRKGSLTSGKEADDNPQSPLKLDFNERSDNRPLWLEDAMSTSCLWKYPDKSGLQSQVCSFYALGDGQVLLTNGGDEAIELLFKYSCLSKRKLILPLPAFSQYIVGKDNWGSDIDLIEPLEDMRIDLDAAVDALTENSILILTSPNNPTGELIPYDELRNACEKAKAVNALVFLDQAYIEFAYANDDKDCSEKTLALIKSFDNLLVLRTLSKAFGLAGIRCGYLLGKEQAISNFSRLAMPFNLPAPTIEVAKKAFTDSAKLEVMNYTKVIAQNREQIAELLITSGLKLVDSSANFVFVQGSPQKLRLIKAACEKRNILIKTSLSGLTANDIKVNAIRITIPFYLKSLLSALQLALKPELICFDMDGVLIDTSRSYDEAIKATVKELSGRNVTQEDIERLRKQGGYNNDWVLTRELVKEQASNSDLKNISLKKVTAVFQEFYLGTNDKKGLQSLEKPFISKELATKLFIARSRRLKTAIVTGRPKDEAHDGAQMVGAKGALVISDDDVEKSKPNPEGVLKAIRYFAKDSCWMLGDTPDDMAAANAAGAIAIGIGDDEMYQQGADLILSNINQLEGLL